MSKKPIPLSCGFLGRLVEDPTPTEAGQWWYNSVERTWKNFDGRKIEIWAPGAAGMKLKPLSSGTLTADGSEQTLVEYTALGKVIGYMDLSQMQAGDVVLISQYMKLKSGGAYKMYAQEQYTGAQGVPILYIQPKESNFGVTISLHQTSGVFKSYDYNFLKEE